MIIVTQNETKSHCIRVWFHCWEERLPREKGFDEYLCYVFVSYTHDSDSRFIKRGGFGKQSGGTPSFGGGGSAFGGGGQQSGGTPSFGGG